MKTGQETIQSSNGKDQIYVKIWQPEGPSKGVLQLIHGMIEHIERYDPFARYLVSKGFTVIGHDHLGHGQTVTDQKAYGTFGESKGADYLVADVGLVHGFAAERFPNLPYYVLGHSMGSLVLRNYLFQKPQPLNGAIIMGTTMEPAAKMTSAMLLTESLMPFRQQAWPYRVMENLVFGQHNRRFQPNRTTKDWLSSDPQQVDAYLADPHTQFHFSLNAYRDLFLLTKKASDPQLLQKIDPKLPLLLISGKEDPVGHYGKSVRKLAACLNQQGQRNLTVYLLEGGRHEILNETNKQIVFHEIVQWLESN
ncbi:alpha/beta hydrolase [Enterococcus sp.]|uniref:alpha/beta fold hydrolase n=1 Tax=Enterococcus sp. TaxID=35783 RepID=UPI0025C49FCC|nr:alpha/beta hydrolase [Enterococcus sp.]